MTRFLIFDLWGPLSSWGTLAVGDVRPSQTHPTRSSVLGLVAGALGITRSQHAAQSRLANNLGLAVMVRRRGAPLSDFHTVEVPRQRSKASYATRAQELNALDHKDNPIVSRRDYIQDACHSAALWQSGDGLEQTLEELRRALEQPVFTPSLGRKSCPPGLPLGPRLVEAASLTEAFAQADALLTWDGPGSPLPQGRELFWDLDHGQVESGTERSQVFVRRDQPRDRQRWLFDQRREAWSAISEQ